MAGYWIWWIAAAVLIGIELVTGTFYLLALGVAVAIGGLVALLGGSMAWQFVISGGLGAVLTMIAHRWRVARASPAPDRGLDVGQTVRVLRWNDDGTARVAYRGSTWDAEPENPSVPRAETLHISATRGSVLILSDRPPPV